MTSERTIFFQEVFIDTIRYRENRYPTNRDLFVFERPVGTRFRIGLVPIVRINLLFRYLEIFQGTNRGARRLGGSGVFSFLPSLR